MHVFIQAMNYANDKEYLTVNTVVSLYTFSRRRGKKSPHAVKSLEIYKTIIGIPTFAGRGRVPEMAAYLASEFREVGFKEDDIRNIPLGETVGMIVRYQGESTAGNKPILLLGHMDVVEALLSRTAIARPASLPLHNTGFFR